MAINEDSLSLAAEAKKSDKVVKISTSADKIGADGKQTITFTLAIDETWHLYANPVGNDDLADNATRIQITGKNKPKEVKIDYPKGTLVKDAIVGDYSIYEGKITKWSELEAVAGAGNKLEGATCNKATPIGAVVRRDGSGTTHIIKKYLNQINGAALATVKAAEGFMNAVSPGTIAVFQPNEYYPTHDAYLAALADAMREEYETIVNSGLLLQLDCPDLAMGRHTRFKQLTDEEFLRNAELQVEALNHALANIPADRVRLHVCWGNYEGSHVHDMDCRKIFPIAVKVKPMALLVEGSNPRHEHEYQAWKDIKLPDDKVLVPGVIASNSNYVEHPEVVAMRLLNYANVVGRERVMAGTDCGFGTFAGFGAVYPAFCWMKMKALAEGAAIASKKLWGK